MTPEVAAQVMGHDEAKKLWDSVQEYYGVQSRSQEDYNRLMLHQTKKGTMKMYEYLDIMKRHFDNLQVAGYPMDMRSFISHVTAGLDEEYTPIVCVIRSQNMSWSEVQLELLSFEQRQERLQSLKSTISINQVSATLPSINLTSTEHSKPPFAHTNNSGSAQNQHHQNRNTYHNRGNRFRGRNRYSPYPPNNRPTCQICGKMGHTAAVCYHRYDKATNNSSPTATNAGKSQGNQDSHPPAALVAFPKPCKTLHGTWIVELATM